MAYRVENGVTVVSIEALMAPVEDLCPECGLAECCSWCPAEQAREAPAVCPGCQAFPGEPHPPYCPDASIEREAIERDLDDAHEPPIDRNGEEMHELGGDVLDRSWP